MRTRNHSGILLLAAFFIFAAPAAGHADNLFRLYPELAASGIYSDNIPLRSSNGEGDFAGTLAAGFFLDYTSAARYTTVHYDTFAQLFAHQSRYDRAGEAQYFNATDAENLSSTTKLRLDELFYRDSPGGVASLLSTTQAPLFDTVAYQLLLANDQTSINWVAADLTHEWGRNWSSDLGVHQETFFPTGNNAAGNNNSYFQTIGTFSEYHFPDHIALGPGYEFYDFRSAEPGRPDEEMHWPFLRVDWQPLKNLAFSGRVGVVVSHTQGSSGEQVAPGGVLLVNYTLQRATVTIHGGQMPEMTYTPTGVGETTRSGAGQILYDFTQRLTGNAGVGYDNFYGNGFNESLLLWGVGLSDRVSERLRAYASFVQVRRDYTQSGDHAVGNYFIVGFNVSVEAFRWSWQ
ncbi:MAG: hypothetical protein WA993_09140 [Candidatus Binatus sp.]